MTRGTPPGELTNRQAQVLLCFSDGLTYKEIGEVLGISVQAVHYHARILTRFFDVKSSRDLVIASRKWFGNTRAAPVLEKGSLPHVRERQARRA